MNAKRETPKLAKDSVAALELKRVCLCEGATGGAAQANQKKRAPNDN